MVDERPVHESAAAAPVATVADFDQVSSMSERDKRSRLKSRGLGGVGRSGLSRPWLVAFLFVALIVAALTAKISMQESELEEAKQQEIQNKKRLARQAELEKYNQVKLTFTVQSEPEKAQVFEGNKSLGQTPLVLTVTRGGYRTLSMRLQGYTPIEKTILGKSLSDTAKENIVRVSLTEAKTHAAAPAGGTPGSKTSAGKDVEKTEAAPASTQKAPIVNRLKGRHV